MNFGWGDSREKLKSINLNLKYSLCKQKMQLICHLAHHKISSCSLFLHYMDIRVSRQFKTMRYRYQKHMAIRNALNNSWNYLYIYICLKIMVIIDKEKIQTRFYMTLIPMKIFYFSKVLTLISIHWQFTSVIILFFYFNNIYRFSLKTITTLDKVKIHMVIFCFKLDIRNRTLLFCI